MCGIIISKGLDHVSLVQSKYFTKRGLPGEVTNQYLNGFCVSHTRLPLQRSSKPQPVRIVRQNFFLVGEYYETVGDEIPELWEELHHGDWLCDWEGDLFRFQDNHNSFEVYVDPLRKRPLYQMKLKEQYLLTNSLGLFLENAKELGLTLDYHYLSLLKRQKIPADNSLTPFNEVKILDAGITEISIDQIDEHHGIINQASAPWKFRPGMETKEEPDLMEIIGRRVSKECLTTDFGVLLSGGVDSAFILHAIDKYHPHRKIKTFVAYEQLTEKEIDNIEWCKKLYNLDVINIDLWSNLPMEDKFKETGSPMDLGSVGPQIGLAKALESSGINVAISGDGADEFFGGYKRNMFSDYRWYDIFTELINYHHPRLDQIMAGHTIELRNPLSALPLLSYAMGMPYEERLNKNWFRNKAKKYGLLNSICSTEKIPLKTSDIKEDSLSVREQSVERFIQYFEEVTK